MFEEFQQHPLVLRPRIHGAENPSLPSIFRKEVLDHRFKIQRTKRRTKWIMNLEIGTDKKYEDWDEFKRYGQFSLI